MCFDRHHMNALHNNCTSKITVQLPLRRDIQQPRAIQDQIPLLHVPTHRRRRNRQLQHPPRSHRHESRRQCSRVRSHAFGKESPEVVRNLHQRELVLRIRVDQHIQPYPTTSRRRGVGQEHGAWPRRLPFWDSFPVPWYSGYQRCVEECIRGGYTIAGERAEVVGGSGEGIGLGADGFGGVGQVVQRGVAGRCRSGYSFGSEERVGETDIAIGNKHIGDEKSKGRGLHFA